MLVAASLRPRLDSFHYIDAVSFPREHRWRERRTRRAPAVSGYTSPLTAEEQERADELLREAHLAFMAVVDESGAGAATNGTVAGNEATATEARPYVVPMNFVYVPATEDSPGRLYLHTGQGRKSAALAENPRVCVVAVSDTTFHRGATPCADGYSFRSVIVEGTAALVEAPAERETALRTIVAKYDPVLADAPFDPAVLAQTLIYAIVVETITYKERLPRV